MVSSQFYLDLYNSLVEFYKTGKITSIDKTFLKHKDLNSAKKWKKVIIYKKKSKLWLSF